MSEPRTHAIFWREKVLLQRHQGKYRIIEYRMFKAVNKNTLRRLKGQGWFWETEPTDAGFMRTPEACTKEIDRLNQRQAAELDDVIDTLKKARNGLAGEAPPKPTSRSLLLKPMGRGN